MHAVSLSPSRFQLLTVTLALSAVLASLALTSTPASAASRPDQVRKALGETLVQLAAAKPAACRRLTPPAAKQLAFAYAFTLGMESGGSCPQMMLAIRQRFADRLAQEVRQARVLRAALRHARVTFAGATKARVRIRWREGCRRMEAIYPMVYQRGRWLLNDLPDERGGCPITSKFNRARETAAVRAVLRRAASTKPWEPANCRLGTDGYRHGIVLYAAFAGYISNPTMPCEQAVQAIGRYFAQRPAEAELVIDQGRRQHAAVARARITFAYADHAKAVLFYRTADNSAHKETYTLVKQRGRWLLDDVAFEVKP